MYIVNKNGQKQLPFGTKSASLKQKGPRFIGEETFKNRRRQSIIIVNPKLAASTPSPPRPKQHTAFASPASTTATKSDLFIPAATAKLASPGLVASINTICLLGT